jgi:beta-phosphoglucomutase-like phosphatase (HAD superfamily)/dTDP-glucose pyrophosphorylase
MNIIIPLGGKGERFFKEGYILPKPLIKIFNKPILFYVLDNLDLKDGDKVFIFYNIYLDNYDFSIIIKDKYPFIYLIPINIQTSGAVHTLLLGLNEIKSNVKKTILLDCDTYFTDDILQKFRDISTNAVFYSIKENSKPIYSYIKLDENNKIIKIAEKVKISDNANIGSYAFMDIEILKKYCKYVITNNINFKGEPYTSCLIAEMLQNHEFYGIEVNNDYIFSLGTPTEVKTYIDKIYCFLFNLDGTLVITDKIYFEIWSTILHKFNIELTTEMFNTFIKTMDDTYIINTLLPNITIEEKIEISCLKDTLFKKNINNIKITDGAIEFIKLIKQKGHLCSIVTNCSRNIAELIIKSIKIDQYIDHLIIGNECDKTDPYLKAIKNYDISINKVFIFEDSKIGLLIGKSVSPKCLIGVETNYNKNELINSGANVTIKNFKKVNILDLINYNNIDMDKLISYIKKSINIEDIQDIIIDNTKLKCGFISDVIAVEIITSVKIIKCVLKIENINKTMLSDMARKLDLYEREYYFYETISKYANIKIPKFYCLIKDEEFNTIGILLENLNDDYVLNLNLNTKNINISLQVIEDMAIFHSQFWNKNLKHIFPLLHKHNDPIFNPVWLKFINDNSVRFFNKWKQILSAKQLNYAIKIIEKFSDIQNELSTDNLTLCHGNIKSSNIFYEINTNRASFIDWQFIVIGKGIQDLIFFIIDSFETTNIDLLYPIFKNYYYKKLLENGILNYSYETYEKDIYNAACYFPFFVAIWYGTADNDELTNKNFPQFFIKKLFYFYEKFIF